MRNNTQEVWKAVEGFSGYEVSNTGKVRSSKHSKVKELSAARRGKDNPRLYLNLRKDGKSHPKYVGVLVAQAFIPNPEGHTVVVYKDGDFTNNHADNLAWASRGDAIAEGWKHGTKKATPKAKCSTEDCTQNARARGMCINHYRYWYINERTSQDVMRPKALKEQVGYQGAHERVRSAKGQASRHTCSCGAQAEQWALLATAKTLYREVGTREAGQLYSLNVDDYEAMCVKCHASYDTEHRASMEARFDECIEVTTAPKARTTTVDVDAIVQAMLNGGKLKEVAAAHGIHYSYVTRLVKERLGMTIREYRKRTGFKQSRVVNKEVAA